MRCSIAEEIFEGLRKKVLEGDLLPGQRLIERELQEEYRTSNSPVREAIRLLCAAGFAEVTFNKGAFVVDYRDARRRSEAYEARIALESYCAAKIAGEGDSRKIEKLESTLRAVEMITDGGSLDAAKLFEADGSFHQLIVDLAGNREISRIYRYLNLFSRSSANKFTMTKEAFAHTSASHRRILDAIRTNDAPQLTSVFKDHFEVRP
jgi:DNA-binding GntR family transcriptional regulator